MKVAIVDDEKIWLEKIRSYVRNYFGEMDIVIKVFSSGESFLKDANDYAIVFMDIEMSGRDGFSVLQEYRMDHEDSLFIILTTHIEMSRQGYKVEAFRYIDKYEMNEKYQEIEIPMVSFEPQRIQCYNILYFEVYDHEILMHTRNQEICRCSETLKELTERLADKGFVLTNRSYLVNLEHIRKVEQGYVEIVGNRSLPLSRRRYTDIRKRHFEWKMRRTNG